MVKFSLDDDDDDDDNDDHTDSHSYIRGRGRGPINKIETLDDYDVQKSFEAMDRHKFEVLTPLDAYQILLALGYLGHGTHHSDKQQFTYTKFQNEIQKRVVATPATSTTELTMVGQQQQQQHHRPPNSNNVDREYEEEIVTLPMLLDIIKKNSDILQRNRSENLDHTFGVFDQDGKGYLTASDLQRIASEVGGGEEEEDDDDDKDGLSAEEAEVMARLTTTKTAGAAAASTTSSSSRPGTARVSLTDFRRLLAPPSP